MKITEIRSDRIYRDMMTALPDEKENIYRNQLMKPFEFKWACVGILVVMAAGMGSRYGGLKQIDPVDNNGNIIIDYSLYDACRAGFKTVVFVIKPESDEVFREVIGDRHHR